MDYDIWLNKAIMKIGELDYNTKFVLKDLFSGIEWNKLARGEKTNLGRKFKECVDKKLIPNTIVVDSPKGTSTTYEKRKDKEY